MSASPAKSFRAAAQRVLEQESQVRSHPFTPPGVSRRTVGDEQDAWDIRLAAIASLGGYDAVACWTSGGFWLDHARNVADERALATAVSSAAEEARRVGAPAQLRTGVALADGRTGRAVLLAPLVSVAGAEGMLVGIRSSRDFDAADGVRAAQLAELVALDVLRAARDRGDAAARRQALASFELARLGLADGPLDERLQHIVEMLAGSLNYDVAQLWRLRGGGSLRLAAAQPRDSLDLEVARPRDQDALDRALGGETVRVGDGSLRYLIRRSVRELIVAPLRHAATTSGILVLGRWRAAEPSDDAAFADLAAGFVARLFTRETRSAPAREGYDDPAEAVSAGD